MRREYLIVVERGSNNFSAYCPDIDGVVATGDTREECIEQMREALAFHIEGMIEHGNRAATDVHGSRHRRERGRRPREVAGPTDCDTHHGPSCRGSP